MSSSSRSQSSDSGSGKSKGRYRKTSDRDALRKYVLKKNAQRLRRPEICFRLTTNPQHIRIRRVIQTDQNNIRVYTSITVCPSWLLREPKTFEEAHKSLRQVKQEKIREEKESSPVESVCQKVWYSSQMVRVTRDVTLSHEQLAKHWETTTKEAMVGGFKTILPDFQQTFSDVYTTSTSQNGEQGYHNKTFMTFAFNQAVVNRNDGSQDESKKSSPNLEGWCGLDSRVKDYGPVFKLSLSHYMLPNACLKEKHVEETRSYEYDPTSYMTETTSKARTLRTPKQEIDTPQKTPSSTGQYQTPPENRSEYLSPDMNRYSSTPVKHELPIHPIAIPGPQSLSSNQSVPRPNPDTPQLGKKPSRIFFPDSRRSLSPSTALSPKVKSLDEAMIQTPATEQKHTLTLGAEIGGEAHEFEGNITLNTKKQFVPKRVAFDKRTLWQQASKNDWNPTTNSTTKSPTTKEN